MDCQASPDMSAENNFCPHAGGYDYSFVCRTFHLVSMEGTIMSRMSSADEEKYLVMLQQYRVRHFCLGVIVNRERMYPVYRDDDSNQVQEYCDRFTLRSGERLLVIDRRSVEVLSERKPAVTYPFPRPYGIL